MSVTFKISYLLVLSVFFGLLGAAAPGWAFDEENRTLNRSPFGLIHVPDWVFAKPEHYAFSPQVSNSDPQHQHSAGWQGQDWEPQKWNKHWTPDGTLQKFFRARIFEGQYMSLSGTPVLVLGPTFFKISELDQRRALKLLTDTAGIFKKGHKTVQLVDWSTQDALGSYTPKGMFLN